ncbi:hypothetical protein A2U01_0076149 [Trifolium medium]|uniref:Uncharacterized protein n=1 Tax=Trifolium medium TaxID=97028 RepID=A0A392T1L1_9FABA|nr:hypothetical protein [Trifolium medium]
MVAEPALQRAAVNVHFLEWSLSEPKRHVARVLAASRLETENIMFCLAGVR